MVNDKDNVIILNARKLMRIFFFTKKCLILCMSWSVVVIELEDNTLMTEETKRIIKIRVTLLGWHRLAKEFNNIQGAVPSSCLKKKYLRYPLVYLSWLGT